MKKIIILGLIGLSLFGMDCPDLSQKENKEKAEGIKKGLIETMPFIYTIYNDALKNYNNVENTDEYMNENNLKEFGTSFTYGKLIALKYEVEDTTNKNNLSKEKYEEYKNNMIKEYKKTIEKIKPENKIWCNEEGLN